MRYRVGYLIYALERAPGGIGRYSRELLSCLQEHRMPLIVFQAGHSDLDGIAVPLPGSGLLPGLLTLGQIEIAWHARQSRLSLIHDPTGTIPLVFAQTRRLTTIHDVVPYIHPKTSTVMDWLIYRIWQPRMIHYMDAVITDSRQSKGDITCHLQIKPEKVIVIPHAASQKFRMMEVDEIRPALERYGLQTSYILYVGSLEPRKNLPRLLQAYALLRESSPQWNLVIVGAQNFWKSSPVAQEVQGLGLEAFVHFTGYIPDEDLPSIYNGADLFVFPSIYEGFGLPVLEAMACGTPVITSNTSSLPEVAGDAALLVDPYNVEEIADAMGRVLHDPDLAADLRVKGLERARQFSWERTARETIAVYEKVLNGDFDD